MVKGKVVAVNGPIVKANGMAEAGMLNLVEIGEARLTGEIIRMEDDVATVQVYEDNTGQKPGEEVISHSRPLSVELGPGLIGNIYDGIQRPLVEIEKLSGDFIKRGEQVRALNDEPKYPFKPVAKVGDKVSEGMIIAEIQESSMITLKLMVPPGESGEITEIKGSGEYKIDEVMYKLKNKITDEIKDFTMTHFWPVRKPRPFKRKKPMTVPLITGQRVIDTFFPIAKGGTAAIPGGFGTGKTMTQHALAKWSDADIIVYIGCGERGNEMTDVLNEFPKLIDPRNNKPLMERTIMIANTSNMPVAAREVSIYTGITIAEYYRDMGYDVALMADSTSRWAEALRELSGRLEEMPAEEGFPSYLPTKLAEFYERAGYVETLCEESGSVSIIGAVSPPGGDFSEPVTQHTKRFIRCFWALDKQLANARHYPSISWLDSYSEYTQDIKTYWNQIDADWFELREKALSLMQNEDKLNEIVKLVGPDALPDSQKLVLFVAEIIKNGFLQQNAFDDVDRYSFPQKQVTLLRIIVEYYEKALEIINKGAPLLKVRDLDSVNKIMRVKSSIPNENTEELEKFAIKVQSDLEEIERSY